MLQQILEKMYIDPELLEELSEDQKQVLFYKMRQEQVRRWKVHEEQQEAEARSQPKARKKVDFLLGRDGCEWVWVMGEHPLDRTIEQILEEETKATAVRLAEAEAEALRLKEEAEMLKKMEEEKQRRIKEHEEREAEMKRKQEEAALHQSIKEAQLAMERMEIQRRKFEEEERKRLLEIQEQEKKAKRKSREIANSVKEKRSSEIFSTLQRKREELEKQALEGQKEVETSWQEQEKKSKEADIQMRENARQARTEYKESLRRSFTLMQTTATPNGGQPGAVNKPPLPPKKHLMVTSAPGIASKKPRPLRPKNKEMIINWFQKEEKDKKATVNPDTGKIADWFHGIINRVDSERMLEEKENGCFLIRVSERVWGYTLTLKESNRCKHFLIDASDLGYQFFGADQTVHQSLVELVKYHRDNPVTISGQERLLYPCGQSVDPPDYNELFQERKTEPS
ncbi:unnamed protein product [Candidula unifasciata]|uniref:SH2 domain-containing protein n=1 Tax=Candidula unifasciata TaxID=100452 RepID=A0A8S3YIZ1_9EUPU|nr:unnamed protein product [Candidula unifasciata]